jgi:hypothetical protein
MPLPSSTNIKRIINGNETTRRTHTKKKKKKNSPRVAPFLLRLCWPYDSNGATPSEPTALPIPRTTRGHSLICDSVHNADVTDLTKQNLVTLCGFGKFTHFLLHILKMPRFAAANGAATRKKRK